MKKLEALQDFLSQQTSTSWFLNSAIEHEQLFVTIDSLHIRECLLLLKNNAQFPFQTLIDLCAVDYLGRKNHRFELVYNLLSVTSNVRITVKTIVPESELVLSVTDIYSAASWYERETWEMYGIYFENHKDLRRLLTEYDFVGYPMRKDFPLTGHLEVRYDHEEKRIIYEKVQLTQDFRSFDFMSPWQGNSYSLPGDEKATT